MSYIPEVCLNEKELSDIYFNLPHENFDSLDGYCTDVEREAAILDDAIVFADSLGRGDDQDLIDWIIADFKKRL